VAEGPDHHIISFARTLFVLVLAAGLIGFSLRLSHSAGTAM